MNEAGVEVYGVAACDAANKAISLALGANSPPLLKKETAEATVKCYTGNDTTGAEITDKAKCVLVPIANGLWAW